MPLHDTTTSLQELTLLLTNELKKRGGEATIPGFVIFRQAIVEDDMERLHHFLSQENLSWEEKRGSHMRLFYCNFFYFKGKQTKT